MPKKKVLFLVCLLAAGMLFRGCSGSGCGSADKSQGTEGMAGQDGGGQVMKSGPPRARLRWIPRMDMTIGIWLRYAAWV